MKKTLGILSLAGVIAISTVAQASDNLFSNKLEAKKTVVNGLTSSEKKDGWRLLYDGASSKGWRSAKADSFPTIGWSANGGELAVTASDGSEQGYGGDIITTEEFGDFILELDYKLAKGSNSGVKYYVDSKLLIEKGAAIGIEFQLIDDVEIAKTYGDDADDKLRLHLTGALYDMMPGNASYYDANLPANPSRAIGKWNTIRIISKDNRVAHYINGHKVADYVRGNQQWRALVAFSKYKGFPNFGEFKQGPILLQDHGDEMHFRSIKIKELD